MLRSRLGDWRLTWHPLAAKNQRTQCCLLDFLTCRAAADLGIPGKGAERESGAGSETTGEPAETSAGENPRATGDCGGLVGAARPSRPLWGALPWPAPAPVAAALGPGPRHPAAAVQIKRGLKQASRPVTSVYLDSSPLSLWKKASAECISPLSLPTSAICLTGCFAVLVDYLAPVFSSHQSQENWAL